MQETNILVRFSSFAFSHLMHNSGAPVAFKTWLGTLVYGGHNLPPPCVWAKVPAKTWWGPVPISTGAPAYYRKSEKKSIVNGSFSYKD